MRFYIQASLLALCALGLNISAPQVSNADPYMSQQITKAYHSYSGPGLNDYRYSSTTSEIPTVIDRPVYTERSETVTKREVINENSPIVNRIVRRPVHIIRPRTHVVYSAPRRTYVSNNQISSKVTTITKTIEKPIVVERPVMIDRPIDRVIERPVYIDRMVETPVYRDRVIEKPVVIEKRIDRPVVIDRPVMVPGPAPVIIEKRNERHGLLHLGLF